MFRQPPIPDPVSRGQESVWNYPRPAVAEPTPARLEVVLDGRPLADTTRGVRTLETSHPPTYYFPPVDVDRTRLRVNRAHRSLCEWKGQASYFDVATDDGRWLEAAAWSYANPVERFAILRDHLAFYAAGMDVCRVDGEVVTPQPGRFYGGWVTSHVAGPFKGVPGSTGW